MALNLFDNKDSDRRSISQEEASSVPLLVPAVEVPCGTQYIPSGPPPAARFQSGLWCRLGDDRDCLCIIRGDHARVDFFLENASGLVDCLKELRPVTLTPMVSRVDERPLAVR